MKTDEFQRAFGDAPDSFELAMRRALLQDGNRATKRIGSRALLIACLMALLAFSAAFAATRGFGLIDMLKERFQTTDAVEAMLQTDPPQNTEGLSKFDAKIEQVISDGSKVYFTLRITPKPGENILILESDMESFPDSPVSETSDETYEEMAERLGKTLWYAYMRGAWTGEHQTWNPNFISRRVDGDSLVYAHSADCIPDADGKLTLSVELRAHEAAFNAASDKAEKAIITADVQNTPDMKSYRFKNPAKIKELGIQITELRLTDTPMARSVQLSYKPLPGLSKAAKAKAGGSWLHFFDPDGNLIQTADGGSMYKKGDTYNQWCILPADDSGAIRVGSMDWSGDGDNTPVGVTTLSLSDAKRLSPAKDIEKKRAAAKKEAQQREKDEAEWQALLSATPAPRPANLPQIVASGCEIPLLHAYPTEYAGLVPQLEAIAAPVGLSVQAKNATITIDQIVPADQAMLVFYTIKSQNKLQRGEDRSVVDPWFAEPQEVPYFEATFDGEVYEATERSLSSFITCEQFFVDDYTVTGWTLLEGELGGTRMPEKAWMTLRTNTGGTGMKLKMSLDIELDRTPAMAKLPPVLSPDALMPMKDRPELGVRVKRVSRSPVQGSLTIEEDLISRYGNQEFLLRDDQDRTLSILGTQTTPGRNASPASPAKAEYTLAFAGGLDAKAITLVPIQGHPEVTVDFVPLDAPLPYTIEHGGVKTTIHGIALDANGLEIRYQSETPYRATRFALTATDDQESPDLSPGGSEVNTWSGNVERGSGILFSRIRWRPQDGAPDGQRVPDAAIQPLKYLRVEAFGYIADESRAITIPLG